MSGRDEKIDINHFCRWRWIDIFIWPAKVILMSFEPRAAFQFENNNLKCNESIAGTDRNLGQAWWQYDFETFQRIIAHPRE